MKKNRRLIWVHPDFASELKIRAAEANKPMLAYTRELAYKKRKKNDGFDFRL